MALSKGAIGIIGGSGLYAIEDITRLKKVEISTPYGRPSDLITIGELDDVSVAFLPRHGRDHHLSPSQLPVKANIFALKSLGVERIISVSAVGSLREDLKPLDVVVPHQIIDRTYGRDHTFFEDGLVAHIGFADPFCYALSDLIYGCAALEGIDAHAGGTLVVIEGPAFSTRAESHMYRLWGADIIGMTAVPEAKLAREAEMCYSTLACVTDYDCWREATESVSVEMVIANLNKNIVGAKKILRRVIEKMPTNPSCSCGEALKDALITRTEALPAEVKQRMRPIIGKYLK